MIHNLSYVHPDAIIGKNVTIEPFTTINKNVEIGDNTWIGSNVSVMEGARIGKNCKIFPGAVISGPPQDLKFAGEETVAIIGDNSVVRECATINRGTAEKFKTQVGKNCLVMAYVHIAHDCVIGDNCVIANAVQMGGHVMVDDNARIGGSCAIHQFVHIGSYVMISGGSLIRKDVPPFTKAAREPLSYCGTNSIGLKRAGYSDVKINEIQEIYRVIYLKGFNNSKAIDYIENNFTPTPERDDILKFIKYSERGIMKGTLE